MLRVDRCQAIIGLWTIIEDRIQAAATGRPTCRVPAQKARSLVSVLDIGGTSQKADALENSCSWISRKGSLRGSRFEKPGQDFVSGYERAASGATDSLGTRNAPCRDMEHFFYLAGLNLGREISGVTSSKTTSTGISMNSSSFLHPTMLLSMRGPSSNLTQATL